MLDLVHKTGSEFGISIIMSSHLLGEIERVCDHLIVIEGGKLVQSASMQSFTETTTVLLVEVEGDPEPLQRMLEKRGLSVVRDRRDLLVELSDDAYYDVIRDAVVELGLGLGRMEHRRRQLEDLFRPETADV
jgi:ABC-2 type transport system ATP-binding protein